MSAWEYHLAIVPQLPAPPVTSLYPRDVPLAAREVAALYTMSGWALVAIEASRGGTQLRLRRPVPAA
jgi:hypothetical protein